MLDFKYMINFVKKAESLYQAAQAEKDDIKKQALSAMVYEMLVKEFESAANVCNQMSAVHRNSSVSLLQAQLKKE